MMGYSTVPECSLDLEIPQLPRNVYRVRVMAGWTPSEAALAIGVPTHRMVDAEDGSMPLDGDSWLKFLELAGRRAFDYDPE